MILDEQHAIHYINNKHYPMLLFVILFCVCVFVSLILFVIHKSPEQVWIVGGTELLLYLMINSISSLIVKNVRKYLKKTVLFYIVNLIALLLFIYLLYGKAGMQKKEFIPIYGALVICFFLSLVLVIIIRKVFSAFKE